MKKRIFMLLRLALLWLIVANATCPTKRQQQELNNSYELARYRLTECQDMGAGNLEPEILEKAVHLSEDIEEMLANENWSQASKAIPHLQQTVSLIINRMRDWDPDGDGLSNYAEFMLHGTSWNDSDSDGDGYFDGSEILLYETDPLDSCGVPTGVSPETPAQQFCSQSDKLM